MGVLAKYVKAAVERKRYQLLYSNWLDVGEAVLNVAFTVTPVTVPPLVVDGIVVNTDGVTVQYYASGGLDGTSYIAAAVMTTTQGQIKLDDVFFAVREPA
jgi:hypothetical protein